VEGNVDLYSAYLQMPLTRSHTDHTVLPANNTISAFTRKHSPGGATTYICIANTWVQLTTHLSTPRGWMAELVMLANIQWTVYPGGHPSTARHGAGLGELKSSHCYRKSHAICITQCYLPLSSGDFPTFTKGPQPKPVLHLVTMEGCKAESTWVVVTSHATKHCLTNTKH